MVKFSRKVPSVVLLAALLSAISSSSMSDTVTGTIDARIALVDGCLIENTAAPTGVDFGTLDFGSESTLFTQADAEVIGVNGNGISILCSSGNDATLQVVNGANDANAGIHTHAMVFSAHYVPYDLYDAPGYAPNDRLNNNDLISVTGDGTLKTIRLYGRAVGASGLIAGLYQDTLTMQVDF
ncbi:MAG: spore coat protein U domain-containing protein [Pseudomonadota bacterium]